MGRCAPIQRLRHTQPARASGPSPGHARRARTRRAADASGRRPRTGHAARHRGGEPGHAAAGDRSAAAPHYARRGPRTAALAQVQGRAGVGRGGEHRPDAGGRSDSAVRKLEKAVGLAPSSGYAYYYLGLVRFKQGNENQALVFLGQSYVKLQREDRYFAAKALALRGEVYYHIGKLNEARKRLRARRSGWTRRARTRRR